MEAIRLYKVVEKDGEILITGLPCKKGQRVEMRKSSYTTFLFRCFLKKPESRTKGSRLLSSLLPQGISCPQRSRTTSSGPRVSPLISGL